MINIFEPSITKESLETLEKVFNLKWLGRGNYVNEFETSLANLLQTKRSNVHTIASCSDAIFGVFEILGIKKGAEVIIPAVSFPAVGSAIIAAGLTPRIIDIDINSGNIDIGIISEYINSKTAAVFITHYGGIPVDVKRLRGIVGEQIFIIEDAACALGSSVNGVACGTEGDYGCWSFDAMKLLTCGEGGAIYISDIEKMQQAKEYFYLGLPAQAKSGIDRQGSDSRWWEYDLNRPGRRSVFTNINAAIGLPQFATLPVILERKNKIRQCYSETLDSVGVQYLKQAHPNIKYSNYFFTVITDQRDELASFLKHNQVYSTFRYYPLHLISIFKQYAENCVSATKFSNSALNIPIHQALSDHQVVSISDLLKKFFSK
jgi:aminotransferase